MVTRRAALKMMAAGIACPRVVWAAVAENSGSIALRPGAGNPVPMAEEFMGLGYEMSSVATSALLSADNSKYVVLVNGLGGKGIIRVGGIVADFTRYEGDGISVADRHNTVINEANLRQFAGFLRKTGWRAIWSLNFAQGSLEDAVTEARAVQLALGSHLLAFELGNEVENYGRGQHPFRPASWDYAAYRREYREWRAAIMKAVPGAQFAAPDTASSVEWVEAMARDADGGVQLLTTHYYRAYQKQGSAEQLLTPDPRLEEALRRLSEASQRSGIPWRMCETNSFSGGGLPGVSDTFVGALWTLDFMLRLARAGCSGANLETGVNQLGFLSCYSPIRNEPDGRISAGVPYYGMLAFAAAHRGCTQVLPIDAGMRGIDASAYALGSEGRAKSVVVVNRDRSREALVLLRELGMDDNVRVLRLNAPAPESQSKVSFGGASVGDDGHWTARTKEKVRDGVLQVPAMSAVVARGEES